MDLTHIYYESKENQPWIKICNNSNGENILLFPTPFEAMKDFVDNDYIKKYASKNQVVYKELPHVVESDDFFYVCCQIFVIK